METIRWEQRFSNFSKALAKMSKAIAFVNSFQVPNEQGEVLDDIIKEGLIQRFEYTHELAWKVMKDFANYQGNTSIAGSRDAIREAFQMQLISNGNVWMDMIVSRNKTSHTYDDVTADEIVTKIKSEYFPAFIEFEKTMFERKGK
ncbi:MAG: hypothetical protein RL264_1816 [Bacteroidota bacterium]|jgi:nucleotidyltransferase substrate binding protein (TIGR01987 family)